MQAKWEKYTVCRPSCAQGYGQAIQQRIRGIEERHEAECLQSGIANAIMSLKVAAAMPYCEVSVNNPLFARFFHPSEESFFLFGPRGVGKSTLMKNQFKEALYIDLLSPSVSRSLLARPEKLQEMIKGDPFGRCQIIIDEIQKVPELLTVAHQMIEEKKGYQFILTGSSARKLKRVSANLLGGRALKYVLYPFMAGELENNFSLAKALQYGLLPLLTDKTDPEAVLHAYVELYLQEEIQAEGLVRHIESFSRFLEVITFSHGGLLNVSNIARECEVKRKTVENYLGILEDLLLAFQYPVFSKRAQRELVSHSKFYLFDAGVFRTLRPQGPYDRVEEMEGAALEGIVAQHLKSWNEYSRKKHSLYFWRTRSGVEVDFVIYGPSEFYGIEVKNSTRVDWQDTKSLEVFLKDYPTAKALLLYRGNEPLKINNVLCLPCEAFLKQLKPNGPIWAHF